MSKAVGDGESADYADYADAPQPDASRRAVEIAKDRKDEQIIALFGFFERLLLQWETENPQITQIAQMTRSRMPHAEPQRPQRTETIRYALFPASAISAALREASFW